MPSRKSVWPGSAKSDRRKDPKPQAVFSDVFEDPPPTQIPSTALAKSINGWPTGTAWRPRNGSKIFGAAYPAIDGKVGYAAHKSDNLIVSDCGPIFSRDDVSNIWVWDNSLTDEMTEYVDDQTIICRDADANSGNNCHIQGKLNLNQWHNKLELWVIQLGKDFYTADRYKTSYSKVLIFGYNLPSNSISEMVEDGDDALVQNSRYMYRIMLTKDPIRAYPVTTPIPTVRIVSNEDQPQKTHQYRYIYSVGILDDGDGNFYHRETPTKILTETGTNKIDEDRRDWAIVNTEDSIGNRQDTYGVLTGGPIPALFTAPSDWVLVSNATFRININGYGYHEIVIDFTDVATMDEMAERIQASLNFYFPSATCAYLASGVAPHFVITSGEIKSGSVSAVLAGLTGTDASVNLGLSAGVLSNPLVGQPVIVRTLYLPTTQYSPGVDYQWHHTHYHIYRTPDTGPTGLDDQSKKGSVYYSHMNELGKRIVNSPDEYVWNKDLRVAAAFIARRINGTIELDPSASGGEFELADEGSVIEFEDGSRVDITYGGYVNSKLVYYSDVDYYYEQTPWMAACIGNGKAVRIIKTGTRITRYPGSDPMSYTAFTASDERRPIWFPNGMRDYIKEVIDADNIEVYQSFDATMTAITYTPKYRNYCDAIPDENLFTRSSAWMCKNRFMRELLPSNEITKQPGFIIVAARGGKDLRYCPLESSYKQFLGYHIREFQTIELEDQIERMIGFTNRYSALCRGSIYSGVTNNSLLYTIPDTFQNIWILSGVDRVSSVGLISYGSLEWIDDDLVRFITNTAEIRDFNGIQFASDSHGAIDWSADAVTGLGRFQGAVKAAYKEFNSKYSGETGYIMWWKGNPAFERPDTPSATPSPTPSASTSPSYSIPPPTCFFLACTATGIYKSDDGVVWSLKQSGDFKSADYVGTDIWAIKYDGSVFSSSDDGDTWGSIIPPYAFVNPNYIKNLGSNRIMIGTYIAGFNSPTHYISTNDGVGWSDLSQAMSILKIKQNTIYDFCATILMCKIRTQATDTWSTYYKLGAFPIQRDYLIDGSNVLIVGGNLIPPSGWPPIPKYYREIAYSTDNGTTTTGWTPDIDPDTSDFFDSVIKYGTTYVAVALSGLAFTSTDALNWYSYGPINGSLAASKFHIFEKNYDSSIYVGGTDNQILYSNTNYTTWGIGFDSVGQVYDVKYLCPEGSR